MASQVSKGVIAAYSSLSREACSPYQKTKWAAQRKSKMDAAHPFQRLRFQAYHADQYEQTSQRGNVVGVEVRIEIRSQAE